MILEITSRCEPSCAECRSPRDDAGDLDLDTVRRAASALRRLGMSTVAVAGGEPILHPRFGELIELVCREDHRVGVRSHGWHVARYLDALAPHHDRIAHVRVPLRGHLARTPPGGSPADDNTARIVAAIDAYRAAGYPVVVEYIVSGRTLGSLVAVGELLADKSITLHLRAAMAPDREAEPPWHAIPDARSILIPQIQALQRILDERIVIEPSLGFTHVYNFCSNFSVLDRVALRASGDVVFCHVCRAGDRNTILGNLRDDELDAILGRHPRRVAAIWSARLAQMAAEPPAVANNCAFCQAALSLHPAGDRS